MKDEAPEVYKAIALHEKKAEKASFFCYSISKSIIQ
jgi:hypothetical protein